MAERYIVFPRQSLKCETEKTAWVIERADSSVAAPKYWAAGQTDAQRFSAWTSNHMQAIQFARKLDAQRVAERIINVQVRVCEHTWEN